jgi:flagellar protein FlaG
MEGKMGFSLTGTHVVFFIAAVIIASAASGVFIAVVNDVTTSFSERGDRVKVQLNTEFKIISDPDNIPTSGSNYQFYLKNIGGSELSTSNETFHVFIDGELIVTANYSFADATIQPDETTTLSINTNDISTGDQTLRVVGPQAVEDEFDFTI